jgi:hypothetical protein
MADFAIKPLDASTWPPFAALVERHGGVWGGCWCMSFHPEGIGRGKTAAQNRREKEGRVREGNARLGGGVVESYPEDASGRSVSNSFLHNGTVAMFEQQGFLRERQLGKNHWVVARTVSALRR